MFRALHIEGRSYGSGKGTRLSEGSALKRARDNYLIFTRGYNIRENNMARAGF
jgi:hypothetical protein